MSQPNKDYIRRMNDVLEFINNNLDKSISLAELAQIAMYSPFHFHRIFTALVQEAPQVYISRKKLEKAAAIFVANDEISIGEVAFQIGFSSNAAFSKAFKKFYGVSPTTFRARKLEYSKIGKVKSKNGQQELEFGTYICNINEHKKWIKMNANIQVKHLPALTIAYVAHVGDFSLIGNAFGTLMRWAGPNGLSKARTLIAYQDDPNITGIDKVRQAAGLILEKEVETTGEVSKMQLAEGKYAVGYFELEPTDYEKAWQGMFVWMNENGYSPKSSNCYQIYKGGNQNKAYVDICVPVN